MPQYISIAVAFIFGLINVYQWIEGQRAQAAKRQADIDKERAEEERRAAIHEKEIEARKSLLIVEERKEIAAENLSLRANLQAMNSQLGDENKRLSGRNQELFISLTEAHNQTNIWRDKAADWERRYEAEHAITLRLGVELDEIREFIKVCKSTEGCPLANASANGNHATPAPAAASKTNAGTRTRAPKAA